MNIPLNTSQSKTRKSKLFLNRSKKNIKARRTHPMPNKILSFGFSNPLYKRIFFYFDWHVKILVEQHT